MKIIIITVGKQHDQKLTRAITEYEQRCQRYLPLEWRYITTKSIPSTDITILKKQESQKILSQLRPEDWVCLLDETGKEISTPQLAQNIEHCKNNSIKNMVFIIGGAYGVDSSVIQRADFSWSLSPLVFPHQLVRLILTEQLYRAHTILAGEHYHHQ